MPTNGSKGKRLRSPPLSIDDPPSFESQGRSNDRMMELIRQELQVKFEAFRIEMLRTITEIVMQPTKSQTNEANTKPLQNTRSQPKPSVSNTNQMNSNNNDTVLVKCKKCGQMSVKKLTVKKENENKGREFYKCDYCDFFEWADGLPYRRTYGEASGVTTRKCSACRQEGHTRNKCPRLQD